MLIRPAAYVYREATPRPIKDIVTNFLGHLTLPLTIIHDLLQGKPEQAQIAFGRLFINTTVGIGGLFDIATPAGYPMHREDMGQTMAVYGVESGPYLMLPLLGPSSFRDALGTAIDAFADPMTIASYGVTEGFALRVGRGAAEGLVRREQLIEPLDAMRQSLDYYAAVRSAYRQQRAAQIRDGAPAPGAGADDPFSSFESNDAAPATEQQQR
jgi:phospholipid-binding lipoprotein MlaA